MNIVYRVSGKYINGEGFNFYGEVIEALNDRIKIVKEKERCSLNTIAEELYIPLSAVLWFDICAFEDYETAVHEPEIEKISEKIKKIKANKANNESTTI